MSVDLPLRQGEVRVRLRFGTFKVVERFTKTPPEDKDTMLVMRYGEPVTLQLVATWLQHLSTLLAT